mgnify:CR=1 FL=1
MWSVGALVWCSVMFVGGLVCLFCRFVGVVLGWFGRLGLHVCWS